MIVLIDGKDLGAFMRDFKKYISQKIAVDFELEGGIWMPRYDRVVIHNIDILKQKLDYIHMNPVKGNLVRRPEDWRWSSAVDYLTDKKGVIDIFKDWVW